MGIVEVSVSVVVKSLLLCCSPDAMILILSGSHGTEEGKEGRIVKGKDRDWRNESCRMSREKQCIL